MSPFHSASHLVALYARKISAFWVGHKIDCWLLRDNVRLRVFPKAIQIKGFSLLLGTSIRWSTNWHSPVCCCQELSLWQRYHEMLFQVLEKEKLDWPVFWPLNSSSRVKCPISPASINFCRSYSHNRTCLPIKLKIFSLTFCLSTLLTIVEFKGQSIKGALSFEFFI